MRKALFILFVPLIAMTSCQTSSDLGSTALIQKRKYTKGFNLNLKKSADPVESRQSEKQTNLDQAKEFTSNTDKYVDNTEIQPNAFQPIEHSLEKEKNSEINLAQLNIEEEILPDLSVSANENEEDIIVSSASSTNNSFEHENTAVSTPEFERYHRQSIGSSAPVTPPANAEVTLLIIILTILLPPLGVALVFGLSTEFWISLLLTLLFYFPGLIYSLIVIL